MPPSLVDFIIAKETVFVECTKKETKCDLSERMNIELVLERGYIMPSLYPSWQLDCLTVLTQKSGNGDLLYQIIGLSCVSPAL